MRMFQGPVIFYDVRLPEIAKEGERSESYLCGRDFSRKYTQE